MADGLGHGMVESRTRMAGLRIIILCRRRTAWIIVTGDPWSGMT